MAGIYIPNMEMPTKCPCRLIGSGYDVYCYAVYGIPARFKEYDECCENETKPSWCPILPVSDVASIAHAHWENIKFDCGDWIGICSNCGSKCPADNYCGTCGAKMDEVIDE